MKLAIVGSRDFQDYELLKRMVLNEFPSANHIVSGLASGADTLGTRYASEFGFNTSQHRADWSDLHATPCRVEVNQYGGRYNALAGLNRNTSIVKEADCIIAFWDGKSLGTKDTITKAKASGKPLFVVVYAPQVQYIRVNY